MTVAPDSVTQEPFANVMPMLTVGVVVPDRHRRIVRRGALSDGGRVSMGIPHCSRNHTEPVASQRSLRDAGAVHVDKSVQPVTAGENVNAVTLKL